MYVPDHDIDSKQFKMCTFDTPGDSVIASDSVCQPMTQTFRILCAFPRKRLYTVNRSTTERLYVFI